MKNKLKFNLFNLVRKVLRLLLSFDRREAAQPEFFEPLILHLEQVFRTRGYQAGINYIKSVRLTLMNYLSGNPNKIGSIKVTRDGIPVCLGPLITILRREEIPVLLLKLLTTILFATRALSGPVAEDLESITGPSTRGPIDYRYQAFAKEFWRQLGYFHSGRTPRSLYWKRFHFTTKTGPNGHALNFWIQDLVSLPKNLLTSIKVLGGSKMEAYITGVLKNVYSFGFTHLKRSGSFRRISSFADKENKTRTIAILDYFSQTVLKNLHLYLFRVLRKIPQDCTFDQFSFREKIKGWPIFYSVDLSSATDRFPISVISDLLRGHLPPEYVTAWEDIMVGYPFVTKSNTEVLYSVGNPMGAYSSWASFALAHHYVFFIICLKNNIEWKSARYVLLGDDVLIGDPVLGEAYLREIKSLGVEYSVHKTHISPYLCEFAKRWIYKGADISPFPISALKNCGKKWYNLLTLFSEQNRIGWNFLDVPKITSHFYGYVLNRPSRYIKKMMVKCQLGEQILLHIWGVQSANISITNIVRTLGIPNIFQPINEFTGNSIFINSVVNIFSQSDPTQSKKAAGQPLGLLATNLVMEATSHSGELLDLLLNVPALHAYSTIEESYLSLRKKAIHIDTIGKGEWPLVLRNMSIPLSDQIFIDRVTQTESMSSAKLSKEIVSNLEMLSQYPSFQVL